VFAFGMVLGIGIYSHLLPVFIVDTTYASGVLSIHFTVDSLIFSDIIFKGWFFRGAHI
jgi:hypothetical protein